MKPYSPHSEDSKRLVFLASFMLFLFGLIVFQFYHLQIVEGEKWDKIASVQHHLQVTEYFMRGGFYSNTEIKHDQLNQKVPFVVEVPKYHLFIDPYSLDKKHKILVAKKIFEFFPVSMKEKEKIFKEFLKKSRSRKIVSWIDKDKKDEIEKWWRDFSKKEKIVSNAIFFVNDYQRSYPYGSLLGQVLQTVQDQKDPLTFQSIPTGGLELYFNDYLQGRLGKRSVTRSLRHPLDTGKVLEEPENGADVYLTINHYIQAIAEEELQKGVKNANAKGGWAIMMDPYTGEILAFAQAPFVDLRNYSKYFGDEKLKEYTKVKAIIDPYEPGSVMKPITVSLALKANDELKKQGKKPIFHPDEKIATSRGSFPGRNKALKDTRTHNFLNMNLAVQKSSNVYAAILVDRIINALGEKWYRDNLIEIFGFSKKTDIELPGESDGFVPAQDKKYPNGAYEWSKATPYSLAMGYNILVNSLQMLRAHAIIANEGIDVKPTLLRKITKIIDGEEKVIVDNTKNFDISKRKRLLSESNCKLIKKAMKFTTKPGGTAPLADIPGYTEAGKTGTAEKITNGKYNKDVHISSFIGFTPVEKPRFILMVVIDEPEKRYVPGVGKIQQGGTCAAPVFKEIALRSLKYLGAPEDDPYGFPYPDKRRDPTKSDYNKELKRLSELYKSWN